MNDLDQLKTIAQAILQPGKALADLIPEAQALRYLFEGRTGFRIDPEEDVGAGETRLESGLAVSPATAALCVRELFRTTAFVRGLGQAIGESLRADRPVRVLYAGCGPYATLALPLMAVFSRGQAVFTLLDIHQECLDDAMRLIDSFGLSGRVEGCVCADAASWKIPGDATPDVIVSETMAAALHNEPQVSIARNLFSQAPEAKLVPQQISVDVCALDSAKEHVLMPADHSGEFPAPERDRVFLGRIFELDAASIRRWESIEGDRLPAGRVRLPGTLERRVPHLLTRIVVYGRTVLQDYDSSLTMPHRLRGEFGGGEGLQFHYRLGNAPELRHEIVAGG